MYKRDHKEFWDHGGSARQLNWMEKEENHTSQSKIVHQKNYSNLLKISR